MEQIRQAAVFDVLQKSLCRILHLMKTQKLRIRKAKNFHGDVAPAQIRRQIAGQHFGVAAGAIKIIATLGLKMPQRLLELRDVLDFVDQNVVFTAR
jgi:hypothetical protein